MVWGVRANLGAKVKANMTLSRPISGGECYHRSDNERGAGRGGGPHPACGRGDVLREFYCAYVAYTHYKFYNEHFKSNIERGALF